VAADALQRVRAVVERFLVQQSIPSQALLLVAVSGGQDSVCLLDALDAVVRPAGVQLGVVHVNHKLRVEAAADAEAVEALADQLDHEFFGFEVDVPSYARRHGLGVEEAGRYARYQTLATVARARGAWGAATGHTADDSAETLLINIVRGTSPLGITSIPTQQTYTRGSLGPPLSLPVSGSPAGSVILQVIRPLLSVSREETEQYCWEAGRRFRRDPSNLDPNFLRNRVRHNLLPLLRTYNPSIVPTLGRLSEMAADDEVELERLSAAAWRANATIKGATVAFVWRDWLAQSPGLQRRLLRRAGIELGAGAWSFQSLEAARYFLASRPSGRRLSLGGGVKLVTTRQGFRLLAVSSRRAGNERQGN
jgi:tRNA(Ile)-lysidine synthetase-like protein